MARHYRGGRKKQQRKRHPIRPGGSPGSRVVLTDRLLSFLSRQEKPVSIGAILSGLGLPRQDRKLIHEHLAGLVREGRIQQLKRRYHLAGSSSLVRGTMDLNVRGFGFVRPHGASGREQDIFIPKGGLGGASHGDRVLIRITGSSRGRQEGRVVRVLQRGHTRLCGIYRQGSRRGYLIPDNERIPFSVLIPRSASKGARDGTAVLVKITSHGSDKSGPTGKVVEILGDPDSPGVQIRMAMEQFSLPLCFPAEVESETAALTPLQECDASRKDLRHVGHVTIDGATAKDFDDAICVQRLQDGYRLFVSIADVGHYVRPGSALDREAYRRGTSVYLPDRVIPMLPERLSNDLCSLVPDEDRPAFTAILDFDSRGRRTAERFTKSMIRSRRRLTYSAVNDMVYQRTASARKEEAPLLSMLHTAAELAELLDMRRRRRGSLGFNIPSPRIVLQEDHIETIGRSEQNRANKLVEECMLAANEAVAETLARKNVPVLYRIHEQPDPDKVESFTEAARSMGLQLPPTEITPSWFAEVLAAARNSPTEYVVNNLLLRTMQQARYAPENMGHFGLAAQYYLHFTSPIRRYPDLVAHRVLQAALSGQTAKQTEGPLPPKVDMAEAGIYLSKRERIAIEVERNVQARLAALFLRDRVNEEFDAIVSGVTSFGLFVELLEYFISGAVMVRDMEDDYYLHDSRGHRLIGERSGRIYQLGQMVRVQLDHVDMLAKRITFSLVNQGN